MLALFTVAFGLTASCRTARTPAASTARRAGAMMTSTAGIGKMGGTEWRPEGSHGTGYRFMPLDTVPNEPGPMLVAIAGVYPGLTAEDLLAPDALPLAEPGRWNYHRLTSAGVPGGFVCLPGSELILARPNTVAVVASSVSLGVGLGDGQQHECIALIDRSDEAVEDPSELDPRQFYALADESGAVQIRWVEALPAGWRVLGRLIYAQLPNIKAGKSTGGFAEMDDNFEW